MAHVRRVLLPVLLVCLTAGVCVPSARAHDSAPHVAPEDRRKLGAEEKVIAQQRIAGRPVNLVSHADRREDLITPQAQQAFAQYTFAPRAPALGGQADHIADTWCGVTRSTDNTADAVNRSAPVLKAIYAYPSDKPSRFNQNVANRIQQKVKEVSQLVADASGGRKTLRWDMGTDCGPQYVDIQVVQLPNPLSHYGRSDGSYAFYDLVDDIHGNPYASPAKPPIVPDLAKGAGSQKRNYVIYADYTSQVVPYGGQGSLWSDSSPAGASHNSGELDAILYDWGSYSGDPATGNFADYWYHNEVLLHEITHTLGGVQDDAPHASGAGHCWDEWDLQCYADGGSKIPSGGMQHLCNDPDGAASLIYDCGKDDYFNPSPAAGSYLATHWNVYDSVFLCAL